LKGIRLKQKEKAAFEKKTNILERRVARFILGSVDLNPFDRLGTLVPLRRRISHQALWNTCAYSRLNREANSRVHEEETLRENQKRKI